MFKVTSILAAPLNLHVSRMRLVIWRLVPVLLSAPGEEMPGSNRRPRD